MQRTVVLIGAGHAHLYVAARAADFRRRGCRLVLVDPGMFWYSGLATGMLGGMYDAADDQVDPKALVEAGGGEFIRDRVVAVDVGVRRVRLASGAELGYDFLSLNAGSIVDRGSLPGAEEDRTVWAIKPIENLWRLRQDLESAVANGEAPRIAVLGGGPSGCEVAANLLALSVRLEQQAGADQGARRERALKVTLVSGSGTLLAGAPKRASDYMERRLRRRGLEVRCATRVVRRDGAALVTDTGEKIPADWVILATGLKANPLVTTLGLPADGSSGLRVNGFLHSPADARVFAAGDCASMEGHDLPKLGVFGVRQAQYVHRNLLAGLDGEALRVYRPQQRYLSILNLGDGTGLSTWGGLWWGGRVPLILKNHLDRRFLRQYRS
ncbi:NAD(P)/FAD-dependent oxidoreductase [Gilvimarinus sp. F26214L]|uniref:NAD(P)/FAD-dependent oxidoreductase n=1 Tax=Gilvimarinus sp. DZF01 TaxID=3461371 RepID=UPI004045786E